MRDLPVIEDPWIGRTLNGRFEVLGLIGKGGMGAIYRCRDVERNTQIAVKIVLDDLASDPEVQARFAREIQANVGVSHPNVVRMHGHGRTEQGELWFAMELMRGRPMDEVLDDGEMSTERVAHIGAQIARGLHGIHQAGIVHRDLKPENVVVDDDGMVKVFDFGLSLHQAPEGDGSEAAKRLTEMDLRIGTPMYMAPEYIQGGELDARSDLYALGVLLYECCTGRPPFSGAAYAVINKHVNEVPLPIEERVPGRHPAWLRDVIHSLLEKDPDRRPQTGEEVAARLSRAPSPTQGLATLTPGTVATAPDAPEKRAPAVAGPSPAPAEGLMARLARVLFPFVLITSLVWHGFGTGVTIGAPGLPDARGTSTWQLAAETAARGADPYAVADLDATARDRGTTRSSRPFQPPSWLTATTWTRHLGEHQTWAAWLWIQEGLFLAAVALTWRWVGGSLAGIGLLAAAGTMGAVPVALDLGTPSLLLLLLAVGALRARTELERGVLIGLAGLVSLRAWLLLPLLLARREWTGTAAAVLVLGAGTLASIPVLGTVPLAGFVTGALPDLFTGDLRGVGLRIDAFGNLALPALFDTLFPGPSGQELSAAALGLTWLAGVGALAGLTWAASRAPDEPARHAVAATWLLALIALPIQGHESWLPLALPAMALAFGGIESGRLDPRTLPLLGLALAVLLYPLEPLRVFHAQIAVPDLPWLAPIVRQAKLAGILGLGVTTLSLSLPRRSG